MKFVLSAVTLASILAPATGFGYLDNLARPAAAAPSGKGMGGYLDNLPPSQPSSGGGGGGGMPSFADSLSGATQAAPAPAFVAPPAPAPAPVAAKAPAAAPASASSGGASTTTSSGYLSHLNTGASAGVTGAGQTGYLDALPRAPAITGGAGIPSYASTLPTARAAMGGAGIPSYADRLSGSSSPAKAASYAPSASSSSSSSTSGGFVLQADNLAEALSNASGSGTIRLTGTIENVQFN